MFYNLAMTAEPRKPREPQLTADGVQEVPLTDARPLLTKLITDAREQDRFTALTVRGERKILLVTPEWYAKATAAMSERST